MPHLHPKIDLVVSCVIGHASKALLVRHKKLQAWLPVGGHWEPDRDETVDEALAREVEEETGLVVGKNVHVLTERGFADRVADWRAFEPGRNHNARTLHRPWSVEVHDFPPLAGHRHLALVYLARAETAEVRLEADAHDDIRWFGRRDLEDPRFDLLETVRYYGHAVITKVPK